MSRCGGCTLCCYLGGVPYLKKPSMTECKHIVPGRGCDIYEHRPGTCREYTCVWQAKEDWPDSLRPDRCHVMFKMDGENNLVVVIDPSYPDVWRRPEILRVVDEAFIKGYAIIVMRGTEKFALLLPASRISLNLA